MMAFHHIPVHNRVKLKTRLLISSATRVDFKVIVIDDGTCKHAETHSPARLVSGVSRMALAWIAAGGKENTKMPSALLKRQLIKKRCAQRNRFGDHRVYPVMSELLVIAVKAAVI